MKEPENTVPELVDQATGVTGQGYTLTRVHRIGTDTVRVRVERDSYTRQSFAVAEALSALLTWTELAADPPGNWHHTTPRSAGNGVEVVGALGEIAGALLRRAAAILARPPETTVNTEETRT